MRRSIASFLLLFFLLFRVPAGAERTVTEIRSAWSRSAKQEGSVFLHIPDPASGDPGELNASAKAAALDRLNFFRYLAGVPCDVGEDPLCTLRAQCAACVLAANDDLSHEPEKPTNIPDEFYETGLEGARKSDIMILNWQSDGILSVCTEYFVRDDGPENLWEVGHRRWMLRPDLKETGFGLALSEQGNSYAAMYVAGEETGPGDQGLVLWPAEGAFPAELMGRELPWTVMIDPSRYSVSEDTLNVTMTCDGSPVAIGGLHYDRARIGGMSCIVFLPGLREDQLTQNRILRVRLEGISGEGIPEEGLEWETVLCSLYPVDPSAVEVYPEQAELESGFVLELSGQVIPDWADVTALSWSTSDPSVAEVSPDGSVSAVGTGECVITAEAVNGRSGTCRIIVTQ